MKSLHYEKNYFVDQPNDPHPDQLHLLQANEFLPGLGTWTSVAVGVLVSAFILAVVLGAILKYKVTVKVPATIRPTGDLRLVQSAIAGTIEHIDAKENEEVQQGEMIARLNDSDFQIKKSQLQDSIAQGQLQLRQIDAQLKDLAAQIGAEHRIMERSIAAAEGELNSVQREYQDRQAVSETDQEQAQTTLTLARRQLERLKQENLLQTTVQEAESALEVAQQQLTRLQEDNLLEATVREAEAALEMARSQRERLKPVLDSGAIPQNLFEEKEQAVKVAEAKLEQAQAGAKTLLEEKEQAVKIAEAQLERAKEEAKTQLDGKEQALSVAQLELKRAETALNPSQGAVLVATERIQQAQARGEATLAALKRERETLLQQRLELERQLDSARKELQQVETDLKQSVIRSPMTGRLLQLNLRNPGQVVQASQEIAYIAPENAPLIIKAMVPVQDIDKVKAGQNIQMQVSACPYPDYGTLKGTVKTVAPDALPSSENNPAPAGYEVTLQPQTPYVGAGNHLCQLQAGMEGKADIISREETVLKFILRKARLITDF